MASLFRPSYSAPIPAGAAIVAHKGKPHARFKDPAGKSVLARIMHGEDLPCPDHQKSPDLVIWATRNRSVHYPG